MLYKRANTIAIKSANELEGMRRACRLAAECLEHLIAHTKPGITTQDLDDLAATFARENNAVAAPLNYRGYPRSICTSVNAVICHGIPSTKQILRNGDIVGIDVTLIVDGWHGDTCATVPVGTVSDSTARLLHATLESLRVGIAAVRPDGRLDEVGTAIERSIQPTGFSVVRDFVGHGIGRGFHEAPQVVHYHQPPEAGGRVRLRPGMTFTIEPMINEGTWECHVLADGWTAMTNDHKLSAQFEHTIAVTNWGVEVLTVQNSTGDWEPPGRAVLPPIGNAPA